MQRVQTLGHIRSVNRRDRLFIQREWLAWAAWKRDGEAFPNVLGYGSSTPIGSLMSGDLGGGCGRSSKVPTWFTGDSHVDKAQNVYSKLPENVKCSIAGVFYDRMSERRIAVLMECTRHQVRSWLNVGYNDLFVALTTKSKYSQL